MNRVKIGRAKIDFLAKASAAWGKALPDWVEALALEANRTTSAKAAQRIGYCGAVVSTVFANTYPGDMSRVEAKVRGALMSAVVACPVVGEIGLDRCLDEQKMGSTGASSIRAKLYRACRGGCPHSRINKESDDA
jgi:hypothetical protein